MSSEILVITPDLQLGTLIDARLAVDSYNSILVRDGEAGLALARKNRPALVIVDSTLPGMSSYQTIQKIKMFIGNEDVPFIVLSENTDFQTVFKDAGIRTFLTKPVVPHFLMKEVESVLKTNLTSVKKVRHAKSALISGTESALIEQIKKSMEADGWQVNIGLDQNDILGGLRKHSPRVFVLQFWESLNVWDAAEMMKGLRAELTKQQVSSIVFCAASLALEAKKQNMGAALVPFTNNADLLEKLKQQLAQVALV